MEAVARELVGRDIVRDVAGLCGLGQVSDEVAGLLQRSSQVFASIHECRQFGAVVLVGDERVGLEHSCELLASVALAPDLGETFEVAGDQTFVPGDKDDVDAWEVLVQRRRSPMPVPSAIRDIVTDVSLCSATSAAVVSSRR